MAVAPFAALRLIEHAYGLKLHLLITRHHHLCDALAVVHHEVVVGEIDEQHLELTAIIGVETGYGANMGKYEVLVALYTLGFNYPKRGKYFRSEFANFVKLADREGWGLGLYIAKTIVGAHGGDIWATSENGVTQFNFTLPTVR